MSIAHVNAFQLTHLATGFIYCILPTVVHCSLFLLSFVPLFSFHFPLCKVLIQVFTSVIISRTSVEITTRGFLFMLRSTLYFAESRALLRDYHSDL